MILLSVLPFHELPFQYEAFSRLDSIILSHD